MSGSAPAVAPERVDAFAAAFNVAPNRELEAARKAAERSVAAVQKAAASAAQLAAKEPVQAQPAQPQPAQAPKLAVVQQVAGQLAQKLQAAGVKTDTATYKQLKADADKALATVTKVVDTARAALAAAEKANMDRLPNDDARKARFAALAGDAGGRQIIDGMVAGIGSKASTAASKTFVADALRARFDVELTGELSTKALPQIYKLLTRVPESHTTLNDGLNKINREQSTMPGTSDYAGGGTINLRCGRAGAAGALMLNFLKNVDGIGAVNHFDFTTLHEVGHSVNHKFPSDQHAGWQPVTNDQLLTIMLDTKGFRTVAGYPPEFLSRYLDDVINKRDPEKSGRLKQIFADAKTMVAAAPTRDELLADPAIRDIETIRAMPSGAPRTAAIRDLKGRSVISKLNGDKQRIGTLVCEALLSSMTLTPANAVDQILAGFKPTDAMPNKPDWSALSKHRAVGWYSTISLKGESNGLWGSAGDTEKNAVGGRVYQESYKNDWTSYDISARADRISNYQFRAGPEWFADLYGVYYSGKLPKNHKYYSWFKDVIDQ